MIKLSSKTRHSNRKTMPDLPQPKNPLHGITLAAMLEHLVDVYGWEDLGAHIPIRCFTDNPSIKSSLTFLRKTDWARSKVERLYVKSLRYRPRASDLSSAEDVLLENRSDSDRSAVSFDDPVG